MKTMALESLKDLIEKNNYSCNDVYEYLFFNKTKIAEKYNAFLSPDSNIYNSPLNPLFSYEIDNSNKKILKSFDYVSLRDGVLPLISFFYENPAPQKIDPVLIVDSRLSSLVPLEWRERVVLRNIIHTGNVQVSPQKKIVLFVSPDKFSTPLTCLESEIFKLKNHIENDDKLYVLFSSVNRKGEEEISEEDAWGYKVFQLMLNKFKDKEIKVLDWKSYRNIDLSECRYAFINPLKFYFTDSFLEHDALQRGCIPLVVSDHKFASDFILKISQNHGFHLHQNFEPVHIFNNQMLDYLRPSSALENSKMNDFSNIKLATNEFKDFAWDISLELFSKSQEVLC